MTGFLSPRQFTKRRWPPQRSVPDVNEMIGHSLAGASMGLPVTHATEQAFTKRQARAATGIVATNRPTATKAKA